MNMSIAPNNLTIIFNYHTDKLLTFIGKMAQDKISTLILNISNIMNINAMLFVNLHTILLVMIPTNQMDSTLQPIQNRLNISDRPHKEISADPNIIIIINNAIPVVNKSFIHFFNRSEWATIGFIRKNILMTKMRITCQPNQFTFSPSMLISQTSSNPFKFVVYLRN